MKRLREHVLLVLCLAMVAISQAASAARVTSEYGEIKDGSWKFQTVTGPSRSDLAQQVKTTGVSGQLHVEGAPVVALTDGIIGSSGGEPGQATFFSNASVEGGMILMDLGGAQPIKQINSFSFHTWNGDDGDHGGRTPQVYTLYGSLSALPNKSDLSGWTKIAEVDSRPNQTGEKWGNRPHGVQIVGEAGKDLGKFRYLLWDIKPTHSPLTQKLQFAGECWSNTFYMELDVHSTATLAAFQSAKLFRPFANLEEVILVYKSHFDIGYTHLVSETIHNYRTKTIEQALDVVDKNKALPPEQQFVWTIPGWPMKKILEEWPGQTPQRRQRIRAAFKKGRFVTHALPFTMQTELAEPEVLVRGLGFSSELARNAGKSLPTGAKLTDVPSHSKFMPTLLKNAGVDFLNVGVNSGSSMPVVPMFFLWEGPDGSRLLTMYSHGYGSGLLPPANWKYKTWIAMMMSGDNAPPPSPEKVRNHINQLRAKLPDVKVRIGTIGDFGDRMMKEDLSSLPVISKDMPDTWIHGPMCNPDGVILARQAASDLFAAESLHTLLNNWRVTTSNPAHSIAGGYENNNLYYEHTWGGAMYWIGKYLPAKNHIGQCTEWFYGDKWKADLKTTKFDRHITSWEEHTDYARNAGKFAAAPLHDGMQALAKAVDMNGPRTVVFNPLPWNRDAIVGGTLIRDIPAGGYMTLPASSISSSKPTASRSTFENGHFKIILDPARGAIRSLVDKRSGRELVDASAEHGFGQYLHEKFSADEVAAYCDAYIPRNYRRAWPFVEIGKPNLPPSSEVPYRALTPADCTVTKTIQGDTVTLEMRATQKETGVNYPVTTRVLLHGDAPYVDLELTIEKPADNWPEAGWICLPLKVDAPRFRVGRNGFIMDPAKDIIAGANRHMYAVGTGVAVFDEHRGGVAVCGPDTPLVSLGEPGCWKYSHTYVPKKPPVYFNLFNNQWSTNYRFWNEGKWTYRFRIWSFDRYDTATALITPSLEMRYPVQTATVDAPAGKLPLKQAGLSVSRSGVLITAFGSNPDGEGTLLRVWEQAGVSGKLTVKLPKGMKVSKATPVNLRGETVGKTEEVRLGKLEFELGAYAPASFILE